MEQITEFQGAYRFLSNFWPCRVVLDDREFPSVEHAYQAAKTTDDDVRSQIAQLPKAGDAKRFGKQVVLRQDWEEVKISIMKYLVRQKFQTNPLRKWLLQTQDAELIEGNWWGDTFWGVCNGKGRNHLGKILMEIRDEIKNGTN